MNDLLEGISSLFADHPDLLRKFIYFLPHRVQEQARERLDRAARYSPAQQQRSIMNHDRVNRLFRSSPLLHPSTEFRGEMHGRLQVFFLLH